MESAKSLPEGSAHPPGGSRSSVELPIDVKEEVLSEEDEDGDKRTRAELIQQLKDYEKVFDEMQVNLDEFMDNTATQSRLRHKAEEQLKKEQEEVARLTADCQSLTERNRKLEESIAEAREEAENAKNTLVEIGLKTLESADMAKVHAQLASTKLELLQCELREKSLREETARLTKDLTAARTCRPDAEQKLIEAKEIIEGMMNDHNIVGKVAGKVPLTHGERQAMEWKFQQHEGEAQKARHEIKEQKLKIGRLENEIDNLKLSMSRSRPEVLELREAKDELSDALRRYDILLESRDAGERRHEKEKADLEQIIEELKEEIAQLERDRDERLKRMADRLDEERHPDPDITVLSPSPPTSHSDHPTGDVRKKKKRRDRSSSSESSERNRKYEERRERLRSLEAENRTLIDINRNLERALENTKKAASKMEHERNEARAAAFRKAQAAQVPQPNVVSKAENKETRVAAERERFEKETADLIKTIAELKAKNEDLEEQLKKEKERLQETADLIKTIAELRAANEDLEERIKKLNEERTPDISIISPPRSTRSDHSIEEEKRDSRKKRRDRSNSSESSERRRYEERKERLKSVERENRELTETNGNLKKILENTRKTVGHQEAELNMLRAALRSRNAPVTSTDVAELQNEIGLLQTKNSQNEFVKHSMSERLEKAEAKSKLYDKLKDQFDEATRTKEAVEEKMKEQQATFARDKAQLEQEAETAREMANVLSKTTMGQMKKDYEAAQKRIEELEKELEGQPGCSSPKRGKWENLVDKQKEVHELPPPPPPPFVLQGSAIIAPKIKDLRDPKKWKTFGQPIKNTVTRPDVIPPVPPTIKQSLDALGKRARFDYRPAK